MCKQMIPRDVTLKCFKCKAPKLLINSLTQTMPHFNLNRAKEEGRGKEEERVYREKGSL